MRVDLNKIEVINLSTPQKEGLFINTHYDPTGQYELWLGTPEMFFRSGWIKCSEEPTTATVVDMQRLIRECQEIIRKVQDANKDRATGKRSKGVPIDERPDKRGQQGDEIHH